MQIIRLAGNDRREVAEECFNLYFQSYHRIGLNIPNREIFYSESSVWDVVTDNSVIVGAMTYKEFSFGLKAISLSVKAGASSAGVLLLKQLKNNGVYGELSGRPCDIANALGINKIEACRVEEMIKKKIKILDTFAYSRMISGINQEIVKKMFGSPI